MKFCFFFNFLFCAQSALCVSFFSIPSSLRVYILFFVSFSNAYIQPKRTTDNLFRLRSVAYARAHVLKIRIDRRSITAPDQHRRCDYFIISDGYGCIPSTVGYARHVIIRKKNHAFLWRPTENVNPITQTMVFSQKWAVEVFMIIRSMIIRSTHASNMLPSHTNVLPFSLFISIVSISLARSGRL